jgi:hypothetical protein
MEFLLRTAAAAAVKGKCLEWPYSRNAAGYGTIGIDGAPHLVHRISYIKFVGPLMEEECALHSCDNPACYSPLCLFKGSTTDNNRDRVRKGRSASGMDYPGCKLTPEAVADIRARWMPDHNAGELAAQYGISVVHVRLVAIGQSQSHIKAPVREYRRRTRLTAQQREEIKSRWVPRSNAGALAKEYGISVERVWSISKR